MQTHCYIVYWIYGKINLIWFDLKFGERDFCYCRPAARNHARQICLLFLPERNPLSVSFSATPVQLPATVFRVIYMMLLSLIRRYQTSPAVFNCTLNSVYFVNLSPINAKLTSLSYVHHIYLFFFGNVHRYHSDNDVVRFHNFSH